MSRGKPGNGETSCPWVWSHRDAESAADQKHWVNSLSWPQMGKALHSQGPNIQALSTAHPHGQEGPPRVSTQAHRA
jgi:hypothetical protein